MSNNSQSVGRNEPGRLLQLVGGFKTEYLGAVGGTTVTVADLITKATTDGVLMQGTKTVNGSVVSVAADGTEYVYKIDVDLKPIGGGFDTIDDATVSSTSRALVTGVAGNTQNMDGGGSRTFGERDAPNGGFLVPSNFASVTVDEGSIILVSVSLARPAANEATL